MCGPNITGGDIGYSLSACAHLGNTDIPFLHRPLSRCYKFAFDCHMHTQENVPIRSESSVRVRISVGISLICTEFRVSCPSADTMIFSVVPTDVHQERSCLILVKAPNWYAFVLKYEIGYGCSYR